MFDREDRRDDRRVHARGRNVEIVRYDRWGRYFEEQPGKTPIPLNLRAAVTTVIAIKAAGGKVFLGLPGGTRFDATFRRLSVI